MIALTLALDMCKAGSNTSMMLAGSNAVTEVTQGCAAVSGNLVTGLLPLRDPYPKY